MTTKYILWIEFADDAPRVMMFEKYWEADNFLDCWTVQVFDPPANDELVGQPFRARIFECQDIGWGVEVDIGATRARLSPEDTLLGVNDLPDADTFPPVLLQPSSTFPSASQHNADKREIAAATAPLRLA